MRRQLSMDVIGTDIPPMATTYSHMIQWDFHDAKPERKKKVDFIYSNALDHSYDPRHCLDSWMRCLVRDGICILHWGPGHNNVAGSPECSKADCFQASLKEYHSMISDKHELHEVLTLPEFRGQRRFLLVVKRRSESTS